MYPLFVGVGQVTIYLRQAQTLKDRRQIMAGIVQKLRNESFSVTDCSDGEDAKRGRIGFTYAGHDYENVKKQLEEAKNNFFGDFYVVSDNQDIFDYTEMKEENAALPEHLADE
jgi:uncharacterized protein YlxP (DUF503 family)